MAKQFLKYLSIFLAALATVALGALGVYIFTVTRDLPDVEALQDYAPPITTRVYAGNGMVLGEYARERRIFVPAAFIPKLVKQAFTSAEDRNFYNHPGIDPSGILRAAIKDVGLVLEGRRPQGAFGGDESVHGGENTIPLLLGPVPAGSAAVRPPGAAAPVTYSTSALRLCP